MTLNQIEPAFDIAIFADLSRTGDIGLRIRRELQTFGDLGYRVGLRHLATPGRGARILPDLRQSVREGLARLIPPETPFSASLAVVHGPGLLKAPVADLAGCAVDRVVLVQDRAPKLEQMGLWFSFNLGPVSWAPTNRWVRGKLMDLGFPIDIDPQDWRSIARPVPELAERPLTRARPVIGRVSAAGSAQWPQSAADLTRIYPTDPAIDFRTIGAPPSELLKEAKATRNWARHGTQDIAVERFLQMLDVFFYFPGSLTPELPEAAISTAMASGKLVVLPPHLATHFGPGPLYAEPRDAVAETLRLLEDDDARSGHIAAAKETATLRFGLDTHVDRLDRLIGSPAGKPAGKSARKPAGKPTRTTSPGPPGRRRALFVPSNGVGLGHVSRLLAVARRLDTAFEPVFVTLAQASSVIRSFGYHAEYLPSHSDTGTPLADWDDWFAFELEEAIDRHRPEVVVFDGNNPTHGLLRAVLSRGDPRMVWIRRGMGQPKPSPYLENTRFFDAVIEPGEVAAEYDTGPTAARRHEAIQVPPIRLLDDDELLPRAEARAALDLPAGDPAVLIQLGAGATRNLQDLLEHLVTYLGRFEKLQIVIAEWSNSAARVQHIPGTRIVRGFPIAQYYNAFDFSIAASGYNTYHEVTGFALPTIFMANRHPSMDDQGARAAFSQDHSLGFDLAENEIPLLPTLVEALLTERVNSFIRAKCREIDPTNGASAAADAIRKVVEAP